MENESLTDVLERLTRKRVVLYTDEEKLRYMVGKNPAVLDMIRELELELLH